MNRGAVTAYLENTLAKVAPQLDTPTLNTQNAVFSKVADTLREAGIEEEKIRTDKMVSDVGKVPQLKKFADEATPKFSNVGRALADATATTKRLTSLMLDPITARPDGLDPAEAYQREREIRREIGRSEAAMAFLNALEADDLETARAILNAPGKAWVPSDIRARGEEAFAERRSPKEFAKRQSVQYHAGHLNALSDMLSQWLVSLGADKDAVAKILKP